MADNEETIDREEGEGVWCVQDGTPVSMRRMQTYRPDGTENLTYSNPYRLKIERVWFDGKVIFAAEQGELDVDVDRVKVAQEYQVVYDVELDEKGMLKDGKEPERVDGQYNIYDSVPGMEKYSPLWQFNYVVVPRDYEPNTLRSEADCLKSGYPIKKSNVVEN
jgi:hypothetical protein